MIADTTFVSHLLEEKAREIPGPARQFFAARRSETIRVSIITIGELAAWYDRSWEVWEDMRAWTIYRLHPGIVEAAADVDRELSNLGRRLGENDNWIAGFCRYYREPVISRDTDFDRVPGLRRLEY
jgi:predicted nucleic acid-binding protein